jgi:hypothetical protein
MSRNRWFQERVFCTSRFYIKILCPKIDISKNEKLSEYISRQFKHKLYPCIKRRMGEIKNQGKLLRVEYRNLSWLRFMPHCLHSAIPLLTQKPKPIQNSYQHGSKTSRQSYQFGIPFCAKRDPLCWKRAHGQPLGPPNGCHPDHWGGPNGSFQRFLHNFGILWIVKVPTLPIWLKECGKKRFHILRFQEEGSKKETPKRGTEV